MMTYPDNNPDNVSGFEGHTGQKPRIPTQIPTTCRDTGASELEVVKSRQLSRQNGGIGGLKQLWGHANDKI